ncbi:hypothetical protein ACO229_17145 [Promicromonospora sp. MS192]|uniref:hypothetical protein n=1 Tax=Promicromonospora sp. MS192 TaxID=3412684 RepID=UPI003C2E6A8F
MHIHALSNNGTTPDGALVRRDAQTHDGLRVLDSVLAMRPTPDVVLRARQRVEYDGDIRHWVRYSLQREPGGVDVAFERSELPPGVGDGVPSFARYLLVLELASVGAWVEYTQLDDADPTRAQHALLVRTDTQPLVLPDGVSTSAMRIDQLLDGVPANAFWCDAFGVLQADYIERFPDGSQVTGISWRTTWEGIEPWLDADVRGALDASGILVQP